MRGVYLIPLLEGATVYQSLETVPTRHLQVVHARTPCISESECGDTFQPGYIIFPAPPREITIDVVGDTPWWRLEKLLSAERLLNRDNYQALPSWDSYYWSFLSSISVRGHGVSVTQGVSVSSFIHYRMVMR